MAVKSVLEAQEVEECGPAVPVAIDRAKILALVGYAVAISVGAAPVGNVARIGDVVEVAVEVLAGDERKARGILSERVNPGDERSEHAAAPAIEAQDGGREEQRR